MDTILPLLFMLIYINIFSILLPFVEQCHTNKIQFLYIATSVAIKHLCYIKHGIRARVIPQFPHIIYTENQIGALHSLLYVLHTIYTIGAPVLFFGSACVVFQLTAFFKSKFYSRRVNNVVFQKRWLP